ncbi:MAG TPA: response regulator transcription factor [Acidimicrobiales bacterium]|nr:response regulator transcription factor [Acidimicrobiales bacterium]
MTQGTQGVEATHAKVLVVDDDRSIRHVLTRYLTLEHYDVVPAANADEALVALHDETPDLVLLDVMLGEDDGLDLLEQMRATSTVPVILLTGKSEESDRVMGLKLGADDYVVKPFSPAEVEARIASVLRRTRPAAEAPVLVYEELTINMGTREVFLHGEPVTLTAKEFDLLSFLASSPRQVFSREQLLDRVWNSSSAWQSTDTVTEHIRRLRKRIEANPDKPRWLTTVWGIGYRFNP